MDNKNRFIELVNSITREGFKKDLLLSQLENSDFYVAPATTKYHHSYKGGLVDHSLSIYDNLVNLVRMNCDKLDPPISSDSIKIVSLFCNLQKMNYYEIFYKNQKVYKENGTKVDEGGRYDWIQVQDYKIRDSSERFLYCNSEVTSEFILRQYCPLSIEESVSILHHHGGMGEDSVKDSVLSIYDRYPLALLLHLAELMSAYISKR